MISGPSASLGSAKRVLIVDDEPAVRAVLTAAIARMGHTPTQAGDGETALSLAPNADLVLMDADLPGLDGFEAVRRLRAFDLQLPIVMITGQGGKEVRRKAADVGVSDFLAKPFDLLELQLRCSWLLRLKEAQDRAEDNNRLLTSEVRHRTAQLQSALRAAREARQQITEAHLDTIRRLVLAAGYKDSRTAAHVERIGSYCAILGRALGWSHREVDRLVQASQMHDVGKIGIPDAVLLKAGPLTPAERTIMQGHTLIGASMLHNSPSQLLQAGETIALSHHERWDGTGYPHGTAGEAIPLPARICAIGDVFDALTTDRPYRRAMSLSDALDLLRDGRGRHFDPALLDRFLEKREEIAAVHRETTSPR